MAGASRLARFNIAKNPQPSNPGTPREKVFRGHADSGGRGSDCGDSALLGGDSLVSWWTAMIWLMMVVVVGYLMVSTWRFYSFKDIDFRSRRPFRLIYSDCRADCVDLAIFPAGAFRHRDSLHGFGRSLATAVDFPSQVSACTSGLSGGIAEPMTPLPNPPPRRPICAASNLYRVAIVGAASLKGKEIAEILRERNFPAVDIRLLDDDESLGQLEAVGDEMSFIQSIRSEQFEHVDFAFFASDPRSTRNNWKTARDLGDTIVDLSYALEEEAGASIRSPWIERQTGRRRRCARSCSRVRWWWPIPRLRSWRCSLCAAEKAGKIERMVATVFEPASENGQKAWTSCTSRR